VLLVEVVNCLQTTTTQFESKTTRIKHKK